MNIFKSENISCKPISTLKALLDWIPSAAKSRQFKIENLKQPYLRANDSINEQKFLVCHDMRNNYLEDKYFQGVANHPNSYTFYHWNLIDMFIYFSHHFVTIPPESWINAAHENNVRILGTFITEFDQGELICEGLFENLDRAVEKLVEITLFYQFDGWLVNIENKIKDMNQLKYFVEKLNAELKKINPDLFKVIWYDSVIESGELQWQNELNDLNKHFFHISDGFFVNYTWKENNLKQSKINAAHRFSDVYVGIDVFGRGCVGNGGFNCNVAFNEIQKAKISYALFAPGWLHECNAPEDYFKNCETFWRLLNANTKQRPILHLPLITSFSQSCSKYFFLNGQSIESDWSNLNLQSLLPILSSKDNENSSVEWCFDDGFYGGNSILVKPNTDFKLFDMNVKLENNQPNQILLTVEYVVKANSQQSLNNCGICIKFNSIKDHKDSILFIDEHVKSSQDTESFFFSYFSSKSVGHGWTWKKFGIMLRKTVTLNSVHIFNKNETDSDMIKLGLIRLVPTDEVHLSHKKNEFSVDHDTNLLSKNKKLYLCISLQFQVQDMSQLKYFNLFLDKNRNGIPEKESKTLKELAYIGSTKIEKFFACIQLTDQFEQDLTFGSGNRELSFNLLVQSVDKNLNSLEETSRLLSDPNSSNFLLKVLKINVPNVKIKDNTSTDAKFYDKLIFDFEFF